MSHGYIYLRPQLKKSMKVPRETNALSLFWLIESVIRITRIVRPIAIKNHIEQVKYAVENK